MENLKEFFECYKKPIKQTLIVTAILSIQAFLIIKFFDVENLLYLTTMVSAYAICIIISLLSGFDEDTPSILFWLSLGQIAWIIALCLGLSIWLLLALHFHGVFTFERKMLSSVVNGKKHPVFSYCYFVVLIIMIACHQLI
ncbi:MAG: hypothetical protein R3Y43_01570 [Alphaproteobacteria bacterium]